MNSTMSAWFEIGAIIVLLGWTALSLGYQLGRPVFLSFVARLGRVHLFGDWTMFGTGSGTSIGSRFWFEYRDVSPPGEPATNWTAFADTSPPWSWHACLWDPQRRTADRLRIIAKDIRQAQAMVPPARAALHRLTLVLAEHLEQIKPRPAQGGRQIRLAIESWDPRIAAAGNRRFITLESLGSPPVSPPSRP